MSFIFDGRAFALQKEKQLEAKVSTLNSKGLVPKLVSIIVGNDPASVLYVNLKKKAAERVGCRLEIKSYSDRTTTAELIHKISGLNKDKTTNGVMIQLPLPDNFSIKERDRIIDSIDRNKDVDGLRSESKFTPPTAAAVEEILLEARNTVNLKSYPISVTVVGGSGFMGKQIVNALGKLDSYKVLKVDSKTGNIRLFTEKADVVVSVTGVADLIKPNMVKDGVVLIDVGSPKGDIDRETYRKAGFVSPVPGGVGPVTISCLMDNLVKAV